MENLKKENKNFIKIKEEINKNNYNNKNQEEYLKSLIKSINSKKNQ